MINGRRACRTPKGLTIRENAEAEDLESISQTSVRHNTSTLYMTIDHHIHLTSEIIM